MGQRHQIYVRLPKVYYNKNNPNNKPAITLGFHNQWLWGYFAVNRLAQSIDYFSKDISHVFPSLFNSDRTRAVEVIEAIYSLNLELGSWSKTSIMNDELEGAFSQDFVSWTNTLDSDNNDGITVIDLENLCENNRPRYCFMSIHHLEGERYTEASHPTGKCLNAFEYMSAYESEADCFKPPISDKLEALGKYKILNQDDIKRIFPDWK